MKLFKYVAPERIDILLNGCVRFTQAADFNDPFEIVPNITAFLPADAQDDYLKQFESNAQTMLEQAINEQLAALPLPAELKALGRQYMLQSVSGNDVVGLMKQLLPQVIEYGRPTFGRNVQSRLGERVGVLSLAESPNNLLMWAHYGDCHRGLALEFDATHAFFNQSKPPVTFGRVMKVSYAVKRPEITAFDPRVDMETYADRLVADLLLTKGKDWEYEQEWRMVLPLDDQQQYPHEISGRAHLFYIPRDALRAVVLGARVSDATTTAVCEAVESIPGLSHVTIRQARTSDTEYEITIG